MKINEKENLSNVSQTSLNLNCSEKINVISILISFKVIQLQWRILDFSDTGVNPWGGGGAAYPESGDS